MTASNKYRVLFTFSILFALSPKVFGRVTRSERLLRREITYLDSKSDSPHTLKAVTVYSRRLRRTIYHSDASLLLQPASNLKIVTTSFALYNLGKDYTFDTPVEFAGVQRSDTLAGDLVVVGRGDPILSSDDLDSAAAAIRAAGIDYIIGSLVVDISSFDSLQWGSGWMWDDEPQPYAMFISPASLNHDVVNVTVSLDSSRRRLDISTYPETSFIGVDDETKPGPIDTINATREMVGGLNTIVVSGTYTVNFAATTYQFSVRHPAHYFGTVFAEMLNQHGVKIQGGLTVTRHLPGLFPLVQVFTISHSIDTVITYTNKNSDNLGAECFLRQVPIAAAGEIGSAENGLRMERAFLDICGVDSTQYHIVDGSGVSHYNLITPNAIVRVLRFDLDQQYRDTFLHSLPIAGFDGTLGDRMNEDFLMGRVIAKTGSISGVSTLSGYAMIPGDTLVFSMMMQNFAAEGDSMDALQDSLCALLSQYSPNYRIFVRNLRRHRLGTFGIVRRLRRRGSGRERARHIRPAIRSGRSTGRLKSPRRLY